MTGSEARTYPRPTERIVRTQICPDSSGFSRSTGRSPSVSPRCSPGPSTLPLPRSTCPSPRSALARHGPPPASGGALAVAGAGEPGGRRRPGHAPPMGRRGSRRGVRHAGTASAVRPPVARTAGLDRPRRATPSLAGLGASCRTPDAAPTVAAMRARRTGTPGRHGGRRAIGSDIAGRAPAGRGPDRASRRWSADEASARRRPKPRPWHWSTRSRGGCRPAACSLTEAIALFVAARRPVPGRARASRSAADARRRPAGRAVRRRNRICSIGSCCAWSKPTRTGGGADR